jgi:hypothetical protein
MLCVHQFMYAEDLGEHEETLVSTIHNLRVSVFTLVLYFARYWGISELTDVVPFPLVYIDRLLLRNSRWGKQ